MTEFGLYRIRVKCLAHHVDVNIAAPDWRTAEKKAIVHVAVLIRDTDISHFRVISCEQAGSVVV